MKSIIFNTEMVKAILEGRKTRFRLPIKIKDNSLICTGYIFSSTDRKRNSSYSFGKNKEHDLEYVIAKYKVDDVLYVKETFQTCECGFCEICQVLDGVVFKADYSNKGEHPHLYSCHEDETYWKPSIHLKQKDARLFLKVINVRVERLQDITAINMDSDMGTISPITSKLIEIDDYIKLQNKYKKYWNSTAKDGYKWEDNPYVFVYEFEIINKLNI